MLPVQNIKANNNKAPKAGKESVVIFGPTFFPAGTPLKIDDK